MADRKRRYPRAESPTEVRRAFALMNEDLGTVTDGLSEFIALVAATYVPYTGAIADVNLGAFDMTVTDVTVTNIAHIDTISSTTTLSITNNVDMSGTYTVTNLASPVSGSDAVTLDFLSDVIAALQHGDLNGLEDDDHTQYHNDTRAGVWLAAGHETTYDHDSFASIIEMLTSGNASSTPICTPVYMSGDGVFLPAKGDSLSTSRVVGLLIDGVAAYGSIGVQTSGILTASTLQWDGVTGGSGGLVRDTIYYLSSATAGLITSTAPTTIGHVVVPIGIALSTTKMKILDKTNILL